MKELKSREIAAIKRIFRNSLPSLKKIESINAKIAKLEEERASLQSLIESSEKWVKELTGYLSVDLIKCEYVPLFNEDGTPKMDAEGKYQQKKQVLTFEYPNEDNTITEEEIKECESIEDSIDNYNWE